MIARENLLARLRSLLELGSLPASACSRALLRAVSPLIDSGVLVRERSGAGRRLAVHDAERFRKFVDSHFPDLTVPAALLSRTRGIARFRDSKAFPSDTPEIVHLRAWSEHALTTEGRPAGAAAATSRHGLFAVLLAPGYRLHGPCALVENPALFLHFEKLGLPVPLVIWSRRGRVARRLLSWLAEQSAPDFSLLHLPDYDPVGLSEFSRLRAKIGPKITLHLPSNLPDLFARFSNPALLAKPNNQAMLATLRRSPLPEVQSVLSLIQRHNSCLEQESLLLPIYASCPPAETVGMR